MVWDCAPVIQDAGQPCESKALANASDLIALMNTLPQDCKHNTLPEFIITKYYTLIERNVCEYFHQSGNFSFNIERVVWTGGRIVSFIYSTIKLSHSPQPYLSLVLLLFFHPLIQICSRRDEFYCGFVWTTHPHNLCKARILHRFFFFLLSTKYTVPEVCAWDLWLIQSEQM
jgi:hypothetical protein